MQLVPVAEVLPGALRPFREHEHELLVVVQQSVRVVGVRGHAAGAGPQRADDRQRAEEVLGEPVDRALQLGLDAVHDHRRVRRDRGGVVRDQQRATLAGDVLEPFPLGPEPVPVDRVVEPSGDERAGSRSDPTRRRRRGGSAGPPARGRGARAAAPGRARGRARGRVEPTPGRRVASVLGLSVAGANWTSPSAGQVGHRRDGNRVPEARTVRAKPVRGDTHCPRAPSRIRPGAPRRSRATGRSRSGRPSPPGGPPPRVRRRPTA